jgi:hypothetical protein
METDGASLTAPLGCGGKINSLLVFPLPLFGPAPASTT